MHAVLPNLNLSHSMHKACATGCDARMLAAVVYHHVSSADVVPLGAAGETTYQFRAVVRFAKTS